MYVLNWKTLQKIVYNTVRALHSLVTGTCICDYRVSNIVRKYYVYTLVVGNFGMSPCTV